MLKNFWYVACTSAEITDQPLGRVICGEPVVLFRQQSGAAAILRNVCPHRQAPLSMGWVEGDIIRCRYHGMEFNGEGRCVHIPSQDVIPPKAHIRSYPCIERYGLIWIWPGKPELADPAKLPQLPWREDKTWNSDIAQYFHVKGAAVLLSDNLLDLSHIAFLHHDSIGFEASCLEGDPLEVEIQDNYISTRRFLKNVSQAPAHKAWAKLQEPVDRTQLAEWRPPCVVNILSRNENEHDRVDLRADHFTTPETESSHHYFVAISRNFRIDDEALTQKLDSGARNVHLEDVDIAEAQQAMKAWTGGTPDMALKADKAVTASHKILARLQQEEAVLYGAV